MTQDTGPIAVPCTMLAEMFSRVKVEPPYLVQWLRPGASIPPKLVAQSPQQGSGDGSPPAGSTPVRVWGQSPQKPENKRFMAFKKTICGDIWLVFMTINAQVCFVLLSHIPPPNCGIFSPPILEVAQLRHQGIGIDAPDCVLRNTPQASCRLHQECPARRTCGAVWHVRQYQTYHRNRTFR